MFHRRVAKNLHKSVNSVSTTRAQLISKGIIYPVRYKELDFTVPEFGGYIQRLEEYQSWCTENNDNGTQGAGGTKEGRIS